MSSAYRIGLNGSAKPKSRFGFVVGREFEVSYEVTNIDSRIFPGGTLTVAISWPNGQSVVNSYNIPTLRPNERWIVERNPNGTPITTASMAQGYGLFMAQMVDNSGNPVIIESPPGSIRNPPVSFYSILAKSPEEVYEKWALIVAIIALFGTFIVGILQLLLEFGI